MTIKYQCCITITLKKKKKTANTRNAGTELQIYDIVHQILIAMKPHFAESDQDLHKYKKSHYLSINL